MIGNCGVLVVVDPGIAHQLRENPLTHKDFEAIADALRGACNLADARQRIALVLSESNPRFDYDRFMVAATPCRMYEAEA